MRTLVARRWEEFSLVDLSPHSLALTIVLGLVLGVFPVYGGPTLLCLIIAAVVRPHIPLLQAINLVTSPLQLALLVPFHRVGLFLLPEHEAVIPKGWYAVAAIGGFTVRTVAGWFLVCVPFGICLYLGLAFLLSRCRVQRGKG